jgi:flagellar biosynthetic protein FliP
VLSLAPAILVMLTSFTRIVVVFSFVRQALGTQQMPPPQLMIGLALFLTVVIMLPVFTQVNESALQPYLREEIGQKAAVEKGFAPIRTFMLKQARERDIALFLVIDMVVASVLMSMGMLMLPPVMISLPFKILLFVLVDGWHLLVQSLVSGFK